MFKLALLFSVLTIGAIGFVSYAQGEELSFTPPFNPQTWGCTFTTNSTDHKVFDCTGEWKSQNHLEPGEESTPAEDGCPSGLDIDITTGECRPFEVIQEEARAECDEDIECPTGNYSPPTPTDKFLENLEEQGDRLSTSEKELIKKINAELEGAKCYQGVGTTLGIQNVRNFPIPVVEVPSINGGTVWVLDLSTPTASVDLKGYLGKIIRYANECNAQSILLDTQGGVLSSTDRQFGYCDSKVFATPEQSAAEGCGYVVKSHGDIAKSAPIWSQSRINQEANMNDVTDRNPLSLRICNMYSQMSQLALGCETAQPDLSGNTPPTVTDYGKDIEAAVNLYEEDGGDKMAKELMKRSIEEKMSALLTQLRALENLR